MSTKLVLIFMHLLSWHRAENRFVRAADTSSIAHITFHNAVVTARTDFRLTLRGPNTLRYSPTRPSGLKSKIICAFAVTTFLCLCRLAKLVHQRSCSCDTGIFELHVGLSPFICVCRGQFAKSLSSAAEAAKLLDITASSLRSRASNPSANAITNSSEVCAMRGTWI